MQVALLQWFGGLVAEAQEVQEAEGAGGRPRAGLKYIRRVSAQRHRLA